MLKLASNYLESISGEFNDRNSDHIQGKANPSQFWRITNHVIWQQASRPYHGSDRIVGSARNRGLKNQTGTVPSDPDLKPALELILKVSVSPFTKPELAISKSTFLVQSTLKNLKNKFFKKN